MSDGDKPGSSEKKWDLSNPQTLLAVVGIGVSLVGSVFGVALAVPLGQDLLCGSAGIGCPHFKVSGALVDVTGINYRGYCDDKYKNATPDDVPPGLTKPVDGCELDFSQNDPPGYFADIAETGVYTSGGNVLSLHFQMNNQAQPGDVPFTLSVECARSDDSIGMMVNVPCELARPVYGPEQTGVTPEIWRFGTQDADTGRSANGELRVAIRKNENKFIGRWRLDLNGQTATNIEPGRYRVAISAGKAGEPIEDATPVSTSFNVYPEPSAPPADTN